MLRDCLEKTMIMTKNLKYQLNILKKQGINSIIIGDIKN